MNNKLLLIILSSLLFSVAFFVPVYFNWLIFIYLVPLFYLALRIKISFKDGFIWGLITYSIHFYYLFVLINERAKGQFKILAPLFIVLYFSLLSGLWFWSLKLFKNRIWLIVSTFLHIYIVYSFSFFIFFVSTGYVLMHPFVPLAVNENFIKIISIIGIWPSTLLLIIFSLFTAQFFLNFSKQNLILTILLLMPFIIGFWIPITNKYINIEKIGYISPPKETNPYELAFKIKLKILDLIKKNPKLRIICMPESSFPFELNKYNELINWWFCDINKKNYKILIGAHRLENGKLFNTIYHLEDNNIINYYDKKDLMFFVEYLPFFWRNSNLIKSLFFNGEKEISQGNSESYFVLDKVAANICVCSELFFNNHQFDKGEFILFFLNESWFSCNYIKRLLFLYAKLKETELNKKIICIGHTLFM